MLANEILNPSPCGDYGSYRKKKARDLTEYLESVPLRGLWFLSVAPQKTLEKVWNTNPSPCGDYGSYPWY